MKVKVQISLPELKRRAQRRVNKYIRLRDMDRPCISCGRRSKLEAGHYIAQGSSGALRFNEDNLNGQCTSCNRFQHGNLVNYRIGLVNRIGEARVKILEDRRHEIKKWTREELQNIIKMYMDRG